MKKYDVAIIGAGPAGSVSAHRLCSAGKSVLLIDPGLDKTWKYGESLPAAAKPLLQHLKLFHLLENGKHLLSYGHRSAWGSEEITEVDSIHDPNGPGWKLNRSLFDLDLRAAAVANGAEWAKETFQSVAKSENGFSLRTETGKNFEANLLIDASGRPALAARSLGARRTKNSDLMAICVWTKPGAKSTFGKKDTRSFVESVADGWWYTALLPGGFRATIFHTSATNAGRIMKDTGLWSKSLSMTKYLRRFLSGHKPITDKVCVDASDSRLDIVAQDGWIAAGDAALSFDPLSSQGLFNALYCGMKAADVSLQALQGNHAGFAEYQSRIDQIAEVSAQRNLQFYSLETRWLNDEFWQRRIFRSVHKTG